MGDYQRIYDFSSVLFLRNFCTEEIRKSLRKRVRQNLIRRKVGAISERCL